MTLPLVNELHEEIASLLERVGAQIDAPDVQPLGLMHVKNIGGSVRATGTLETKVIRGAPATSTTAVAPNDEVDD
jgi:hypothetical protein